MRRAPLGLAAMLIAIAPASPGASQAMPYPPESRWDSLARLEYRPGYHPRAIWAQRAKDAAKGCDLKPDAQGVVRLSIPFLVLLSPTAVVQDAHVDETGCEALAALVAQFARALGPALLVPPRGVPPHWRASHFLAGWQQVP